MKANLAPSKKEGRRLVEQGVISVNDVKNYQPYRTIYGRKL